MKTRRIIGIAVAAVALAAAATQLVFFLRYPYFRKYAAINGVSLHRARQIWGHPSEASEANMGMAVEASFENWDAVERLSRKDRHTGIGTYYYNLSNAMKGQLPDKLLDFYQPFETGLFLPVGDKSSPFVIGCAGDVWWALNYMPLAERDAMLGMLFSPAHNGSRYLRRLAEANLVKGDYEAASKHLRILMNSRADKAWANARLPENWTPEYRSLIEYKRSFLPRMDFVHGMDQTPMILRILLNSNASNTMALDYLLCYDLLTKNLDAFMADFAPSLTQSVLYEEAVLIFLASKDGMDPENFRHYNISEKTLERFNRFVTIYRRDNGALTNLTRDFGKTYWYYYYFARRNEKQ